MLCLVIALTLLILISASTAQAQDTHPWVALMKVAPENQQAYAD